MSTTTAEASTSNVVTQTVARGLCIGCGVCAGVCPVNNLRMAWNQDDLYAPQDAGHCLANCRLCTQVCPFLDHEETIDSLAQARFAAVEEIRHTPETGYYHSCFAGAVCDETERRQSVSGGLASWLLARVLADGQATRIICVTPTPDPDRLFAYTMLDTPEAVKAARGSAYYPVEISEALRTVQHDEGRYVIIGLPCVLKAVRLAMHVLPRLRERIVLLVGLVCGKTRSKGFAELLLRASGSVPERITSFQFRVKAAEASPALSYFSVNGTVRSLPAADYARTWVSGQLTPRACQFCDDIFAEVADVVLMDAWIPPYLQDARGTNIALIRSASVQSYFAAGEADGLLTLVPLDIAQVIASQRGVIQVKRAQLACRLWLADREAQPRPRTRLTPQSPTWLQHLRLVEQETVRRQSFAALRRQRETGERGITCYEREMRRALRRWHLFYELNETGILRTLAGMARYPLKIVYNYLRKGKS